MFQATIEKTFKILFLKTIKIYFRNVFLNKPKKKSYIFFIPILIIKL